MKSETLIASVIIPVYNKEKYLNNCIEVLNKQTLDHDKFEAIFVDDGSKDQSLRIIENAAKNHAWIRVIAQENGGVCSARNTGIRAAQGTYLFYLDPDDDLSPDTLLKVSNFFDGHKNEIDLVTYKIVPYDEGEKKNLHFRYDVLTASGVYDLQRGDNWLVCQTTMNICVKNKFENNHTFNFKTNNGTVYHEDQQYITEILHDKKKIGYCAGPKYNWNKNSSSASNNIVNPYFIFDNTMTMFETLFSLDGGTPSKYIQGLFINDLAWKMRSSSPLPTHLQGEEYRVALERFKALLKRVDDAVILRHPTMQVYHKYFFLQLKSASNIELKFGPNGISAMRDGKFLFSREKVNLHILRTRLTKRKLLLFGVVKSPFFLFSDEMPTLSVQIQNKEGFSSTYLPLCASSMSTCGSTQAVAKFFNFRYEINLNTPSRTAFKVEFAGYNFDTYLSFLETRCNFSQPLNYLAFQGNTKIAINKDMGAILVSRVKNPTVELKSSSTTVKMVRKLIQVQKKKKEERNSEIWLYSDTPNRLDNAWYQFLHDAQKNDGVTRYYVAHNVNTSSFTPKRNAKVIEANTRLHKLLYLNADKILVSDIVRDAYVPWANAALKKYADLFNAELIYLQHGVLWAHLPNYYSYDRVLFDKEVISTKFEMENLTANYGFLESDLLACGMPRYDFIDADQQPKKKILLCPSWRQYLIGDLVDGKRESFPDKFQNSDYYKGLAAFLSNAALQTLLNEYGFTLELKMHPNFSCYKDLFKQFENDNIRLISGSVSDAEYAVAITDYSSYSFDFVYLNRPIIYYIPDEKLFYAGVNHYNSLDISLDHAYGEYVHDGKDLVEALEKILKNDCMPLPEYQERCQSLFLYRDNNNRERIYRAIRGIE